MNDKIMIIINSVHKHFIYLISYYVYCNKFDSYRQIYFYMKNYYVKNKNYCFKNDIGEWSFQIV